MNQITLIVHTDWTKSCMYHPEAISHESLLKVTHPYITDEIMLELRNETTNRKRIEEILNSLTNL